MQRAKTDSRVAATATSPTSTRPGISRPKTIQSRVAPTVSTAPIPWAKRLGGPAISLALKGSRGTMTRVTI